MKVIINLTCKKLHIPIVSIYDLTPSFNSINLKLFSGLLPETYSDPDFPGVSNVEFEGGQQPHFSNNANDRVDMKHLPNLKPNERAGNLNV